MDIGDALRIQDEPGLGGRSSWVSTINQRHRDEEKAKRHKNSSQTATERVILAAKGDIREIELTLIRRPQDTAEFGAGLGRWQRLLRHTIDDN